MGKLALFSMLLIFGVAGCAGDSIAWNPETQPAAAPTNAHSSGPAPTTQPGAAQ